VQAGILHSQIGKGGGYTLARSAGAVSLLEVMEATNGPIDGRILPLSSPRREAMWRRLQAACDAAATNVRRILAQVSLADLAAVLEPVERPPAPWRDSPTLPEMIRLRKEGLTLAAIGARLGVSRQAVHCALTAAGFRRDATVNGRKRRRSLERTRR